MRYQPLNIAYLCVRCADTPFNSPSERGMERVGLARWRVRLVAGLSLPVRTPLAPLALLSWHERGVGLGAMLRIRVLGKSGDPEQIRTADLLLDREAC